MKLAVTLRAWLIVITQLPAPVHAPLQPAKTEPVDGVATKVIVVPLVTFALQVAPQSIVPGGVLVMVPAPDPAFITVSAKVGGGSKVAVTVRACVMETMQLPLPVQAPDQPAKTEPLLGVAASVTDVPSTYVAAQLEPQLIEGDAGLVDATVPVPAPAFTTVRA